MGMNENVEGPRANCDGCKEFVSKHPWNAGERRHEDTRLISPIQCAFDGNGNFISDNWNCVALDPLREMAYEVEVHNEDQNAAIIRFGVCTFLIIGYYKHRGRTDMVAFMDSDGAIRPMRLSDLKCRDCGHKYDRHADDDPTGPEYCLDCPPSRPGRNHGECRFIVGD